MAAIGRMFANMDCRRIGYQELEGFWKRTEAFAYVRLKSGWLIIVQPWVCIGRSLSSSFPQQ